MRIGVWGGSFDPIHLGHLLIAGEAHLHLQLDRVVFVPAFVSPFKQGKTATDARIRLEMAQAAVEGDARFEVDSYEALRNAPSYTVDTLRHFKERYGRASELFLLIGGDWIQSFTKWKEHEEILKLSTVAVFGREGKEWTSEAGFAATALSAPRIDVSSTWIRERVRVGEPIRYWVPEPVIRIIEREKLYKGDLYL